MNRIEEDLTHILLADDHNLFREALAELLSQWNKSFIFHHANSLDKAIHCLHARQFNLVLLDLGMPGMKGAESIKKVSGLASDAFVVIVSADESPATIRGCIKTGVDGYILKSADGETLIQAITSVMQGVKIWPDSLLLEKNGVWTDKQLQLLSCLAEGLTNREIANKLFLSEGTVKQYVSKILVRLDVTNRTQAGMKARSLLQFNPQ